LHPFGSVEDQNRIIAEVRKLAGEIVVTSPAVGQEDDEEDEDYEYEDEE
jgi:hypothetical protein